jgi:hypothetical protein
VIHVDADGTREEVEEKVVHHPHELDTGHWCKEHRQRELRQWLRRADEHLREVAS